MKRLTVLVISLVLALASSLVTMPAATASPGSMAGSVRDPSGLPVTDGFVEFYLVSAGVVAAEPSAQEYLDQDGRWRVVVSSSDLPAGRYLIRAYDWDSGLDGWYPAARSSDGATPVDVAEGAAVTGIEVTLPAPASVGGVVTGPGGEPLTGAMITLYPSTWLPGASLVQPDSDLTTQTDSAGRWAIESELIAPDSYLIRAGHSGHDARWLGGVTAQQATRVSIGTDSDRGSLDIRLGSLPGITGSVSANGRRIEAMQVTAEALDELGPEVTDSQFSVLTISRGDYRLSVPSGRYRIRVDDPQSELPTRWYAKATRDTGATVLTVSAGRTLSGISVDASFQPNFPGKPRTKPKGLRPPKGLAARPMDPIDDYEGQSRCRPQPKPGTVTLAQLLRRRYGPVTIGLNRACAKDRSEHYDGRALDWMVNSRNRDQARKGDDFVKWLTMSRGRHVGAMARRLGIMYVIWRDRIWGVYAADEGWRPYNDCLTKARNSRSWDNDCHRNHVHISLTWDGARKQTTWWGR